MCIGFDLESGAATLERRATAKALCVDDGSYHPLSCRQGLSPTTVWMQSQGPNASR